MAGRDPRRSEFEEEVDLPDPFEVDDEAARVIVEKMRTYASKATERSLTPTNREHDAPALANEIFFGVIQHLRRYGPDKTPADALVRLKTQNVTTNEARRWSRHEGNEMPTTFLGSVKSTDADHVCAECSLPLVFGKKGWRHHNDNLDRACPAEEFEPRTPTARPASFETTFLTSERGHEIVDARTTLRWIEDRLDIFDQELLRVWKECDGDLKLMSSKAQCDPGFMAEWTSTVFTRVQALAEAPS